MRTVDPDGHIIEWVTEHEWTLVDGSALMMSRPKDQDQDEPATPPRNQTRSLGWTGYQLTARELREWLDHIPNQATIEVFDDQPTMSKISIIATWEIP